MKRNLGLDINNAWFASLFLSIAWLGLAACVRGAPAQAPVTTNAVNASKVSPALQAAAQQLMEGKSPSEFKSGLVRADSQGRIQVYVYISSFSSDNLTTLSRHGLVDGMPSQPLHLVQGWIMPQDLAGLAALPFVSRITPPHYAQPR